jgi:protoheme IX farnesyltransferase
MGNALYSIDIKHFLVCSLSFGCTAGASLAANQILEVKADAKMKRTKDRPLAAGRISKTTAFILVNLFFWPFLWLLYSQAGGLCASLTFFCGFSYVFIYTPLKYLNDLSTLVGAIPGALLPLMGWSAVDSNILVGPVLYCSLILYLWQIPHTMVITLKYLNDYRIAGMHQLPLDSGEGLAIEQAIYWTALMVLSSYMPIYYDWVYPSYVFCISPINLFLLFFSIRYFKNKSQSKSFFISLNVYLIGVLFALGIFLK